ncbi:hypothetical protein AD929_04395 [Gluconobacter potus]|uniref:Uncharacterized protein n=1 Tax=Gluconobacter potus TaxID=2724927 RepID=A0A149QY33_9PROT|nr:hypothetical protein AD929_04395 [Gluconobacter potus]
MALPASLLPAGFRQVRRLADEEHEVVQMRLGRLDFLVQGAVQPVHARLVQLAGQLGRLLGGMKQPAAGHIEHRIATPPVLRTARHGLPVDVLLHPDEEITPRADTLHGTVQAHLQTVHILGFSLQQVAGGQAKPDSLGQDGEQPCQPATFLVEIENSGCRQTPFLHGEVLMALTPLGMHQLRQLDGVDMANARAEHAFRHLKPQRAQTLGARRGHNGPLVLEFDGIGLPVVTKTTADQLTGRSQCIG